jgi:16S rRNA (guanine966-N2)-methyltransferase
MKKPATSQLRIIGGQWKRRSLSFLAIEGLRPTPDRVRETLFNWLQFNIQGTRCLDMFAGSGALGVEALSRGAAECVFFEKNPAQAKYLQQALQVFGCTTNVLVGDSLQLITQQKTPFDVVFLDPPYGLKLWHTACELLVTHQLIHANSLIYIESDCEWESLNLPPQWHCLKSTTAGTVHGFLAQYEFNV